MKRRNRLLPLLTAAALVLSLAACGAGGSAGSPPPEEAGTVSYRTLYASEVTTLNYLSTTQANETAITFNVVDCLVEYDCYGNVEPALATSWEHNEDASEWTFHLREGVKWVDREGKEAAAVTAEDWVTAARYVCDAANDCSTFSAMNGIIRGAKEYYDYTAYLLALDSAVDGTDQSGAPCKLITGEDGAQRVLEEVAAASPQDIGVTALDPYTLRFTLTSPMPYFLSMVSYGAYMPVYAPFLRECGDKFGTDNDHLLYCGAFLLSSFRPQQERVLTKNPAYWEANQVFLDRVVETYNAEASSLAATMYLNGEVDAASVSSDLLSAMLADPRTADALHPSRPDTAYSYWYLFNFDPNFDPQYEPENWTLAVNNEDFRKSILHAFNLLPALATGDAIDPESSRNNTITPVGFATGAGDYTAYGGLPAYVNGNNYDPDLALEFRDKARAALTKEGALFPVKMLLCYNPTSPNWANECQVAEQQIEGVLGSDYVDVIVQAGPDTGFLGAVRRSGNYAFMKCNWGADYADPQTWTDPFAPGSSYSFIYKSTHPTTAALYNEYTAMVDRAKGITGDMAARYEAFAQAETFLLDHAFALPIHTSAVTYSMSRLNIFEGQYAPFGGASQRYKDRHLMERSMSMGQFAAAYQDWKAHMGK